MTSTKTISNKKTIAIMAISMIGILFVGCADKAPGSSYDNDSAKWQQHKAKEAVDNIDR